MFGERMRTVLEKENLTTVKAAEMLGVSQPRLAQWLSGKNEPSQENIKRFCELFHTTPNYLFGFDDGISEEDRALLQAFKSMATAQASNIQNQNIPEQTKTSER